MALNLDLAGLFRETGAARDLPRAAFEAALPAAAAVRAAHESAPPVWRGLHARPELRESCVARAAAVRTEFPDLEALVVLGIGGSALGASAMTAALAPVYQEWRPEPGRPRVFVLDSPDPDWIGALLEAVPPERCHFNVVSKSGGTLETAAQFLIFYDAVRKATGSDERARRCFTLTTDPESGHFRALARDPGFAALEVPPGVGGRFSVLSPVGLFPAELAGFDTESLLAGAARVDGKLSAAAPGEDAALAWALAHTLHLQRGRNVHVHFAYGYRLRLLADWFRQIWAESLGKRLDAGGRVRPAGPTPVKAVGPTDQHSQVQLYAEGPPDKVFTILKLDRFGRDVEVPPAFVRSPAFEHLPGHTLAGIVEAERQGTEVALREAGQPVCTLELCKLDAFHLGQYFQFFQIATAYAGGLLDLDPYDQPGVEAGKLAAMALMGCAGHEERARAIRAAQAAAPEFRLSC